MRGRPGLLALLLVASSARAEPLRDAQAALLDADYTSAEALAAPLTRDPTLAPAVRAEAHRVHGLALFALARRDEAEAALLSYLELDADARLDPALYPPDMVVFFEDVRARHAGQLLTVKPRPKRKQSPVLNFIPPFGQFQNRQPVKAWIVGVAEVAFLTAHLATYAMLRSRCDSVTLVCDDPDTARTLRAANLAAGGLLVATYVFGVVDGFIGYQPDAPAEPATRVGIAPLPSGGLGFISRSF
jgi:hypothetical protein